MDSIAQRILDEQNFPYEGMSLEERNTYLNILRHCKDICDSSFVVNNSSRAEILNMNLKKETNQIRLNGVLTIGSKENRCIDGYIFLLPHCILVDTHVTRLLGDENLEYTVLDEFKFVGNKLIRNSFYNHDMKTIATEINDATMKGLIK